jgi:hypothetical protein
MATKTRDDYIEESRKTLNPTKEKEIKSVKDAAAASKKSIKSNYSKQITDTTDEYEGLFRKNDVQKYINSRALERRAAEMGYTDSGLSRMQQTANQLSHANQNSEYVRQKQKAVDTLTAAMLSETSEVDTKLNSSISDIETAYEKSAIEQGTSAYNSDLDRENEFAIAKYESDNKKEVDLAKAAVNKTNADTANIKAQNEAIKLSNQAAQDEANTKKEAFNDLYGSIAAEYKVNKKPSTVHLSIIKDYQDENGLDSDSIEIKRLLSAAHIPTETYNIYSETGYITTKTDKAVKFVSDARRFSPALRKNNPTRYREYIISAMDSNGLNKTEGTWAAIQLGII